MREGWKRAALGQIADLSWGDTNTTKSAYVATGYTAFSASGPDGFLPYFDYDRTGVVLSAIGSECGKTWLTKGKWSCIKNTMRFFSKSEDIETEFLYWATRSGDVWPKRGSGQPFISQGDARACEVSFPPLPEQRAIAATLGALDDKIELNRKMNATLEAMARAMFRDWFVDFGPTRAKMEGAEPYLSPDLWALFPDRLDDEGNPAEWELSNIGSKLTTMLGGTPARKNMTFWGGHIPWINSGKANEFRVIEPSEFITQQGLDRSATKLLPRRTTLIAITGATLGQVSLNEIETCANQSIVGVVGSIDYPGEFVYFWVKENIDSLISTQTGAAQQHINKGNVDELSFLCPAPELLSAWLNFATPLFDRISSNCFESRTLAQTRDLLLPRLMSGELRVTDPVSSEPEISA